jgi:hypothetical protein
MSDTTDPTVPLDGAERYEHAEYLWRSLVNVRMLAASLVEVVGKMGSPDMKAMAHELTLAAQRREHDESFKPPMPEFYAPVSEGGKVWRRCLKCDRVTTVGKENRMCKNCHELNTRVRDIAGETQTSGGKHGF